MNDMNNMNQCKVNKRESLEIVDQTQTQRYVSRFEHPALRPHLHTEGFSLYVHTGPSTKVPPLKNYNSALRVHNSSLKHNHLYTRGIGTKPNHNHLYTRGIRHKAKTQIQSPLQKRDRHKAKAQSSLHKRDKAQSQITITSTQEG